MTIQAKRLRNAIRSLNLPGKAWARTSKDSDGAFGMAGTIVPRLNNAQRDQLRRELDEVCFYDFGNKTHVSH